MSAAARVHNACVHAVADAMGAEVGLHELMLTAVCGNCFCRRPKPTVDEATWSGHVLVAPSGCLHRQSYKDDCTDTCCGLDATGQNWWWPL